MGQKQFKPASRVLAGPVLVASIVRQGNGRPGSPVRWLRYRQHAEAEALLWAELRMAYAPRVEMARSRPLRQK